jgi:hypothetical protein
MEGEAAVAGGLYLKTHPARTHTPHARTHARTALRMRRGVLSLQYHARVACMELRRELARGTAVGVLRDYAPPQDSPREPTPLSETRRPSLGTLNSRESLSRGSEEARLERYR